MSSSNTSLDVVIPVYNEEATLAPNVVRLYGFLQANCPYRWRIVIADNASNDATPQIGQDLADRWPRVAYLRMEQKGKGRALRRAWLESPADVVCYMDVDLSTDLKHLKSLVEPLAAGEKHIATGSRLMPDSMVIGRPLLREVTSRVYNLSIRLMFPGCSFVDAQCGFKAATRQTIQELVPQVEDNGRFFDTELLLRAEAAGYAIHQIPVRWVQAPGSTVNVVSFAWKSVRGLFRVRLGAVNRGASTEE